jgi:hypothetical protein
MSKWLFADPPNLAVIVDKRIIANNAWIAYVSHDLDDGAWQFHAADSPESSQSESVVISLRNVVERDPTVAELANLPLGWHAWRSSHGSEWQRASEV